LDELQLPWRSALQALRCSALSMLAVVLYLVWFFPQTKEGSGETCLAADIDEKEVVIKVLSVRVAGIQPKRIIQVDEERMWVLQVKLDLIRYRRREPRRRNTQGGMLWLRQFMYWRSTGEWQRSHC
jgi:hypothetical protein